MHPFIKKSIFFVGWILSPLSFWNDPFVNIPLAYLAANFIAGIFHIRFSLMLIICYWVSNALGILLMLICGKDLFAERSTRVRQATELCLTIIAYSALIIVLNKIGVLRPFLPHVR